MPSDAQPAVSPENPTTTLAKLRALRVPQQVRKQVITPSHDITIWLQREYARSRLQVQRIPFDRSGQWRWDERGFWTHMTGRFFNVVGVRYFSVARGCPQTQPIIDQSEIGLLSFLVSCRQGQWRVLAHAKVEPGNVNGAQLAPTVQATRSNYEVVHGGTATPYLELARPAGRPLCDLLQSEQNSRFLAKRNCNRVVLLPERVVELDSRFRWMPVATLLSLLGESHIVNTDARSVLVCWLFTDAAALRQCLPARNPLATPLVLSLESSQAMHAGAALARWLEALNEKWTAGTTVIPLQSLEDSWRCQAGEIASPHEPSLEFHQIAVHCAGREVSQWDQPIAGSRTRACLVLLIGMFRGTLHLLLQAVLEAGNRDGFELTTTVQADSCDRAGPAEQRYLGLAETSGRTLVRFANSEEGGRFDHCVSEYEIVWLDEVTEEQEGPFHRWVSLAQFAHFLRQGNRITNELRSAVSALLSVDHE